MEYGDFAYCYDIFMDETPYERWSEFLADTLKKEGIEDGLVLDLGCGTGRLTNALSDMGYDMIGVDSSQEMLGVAAEGKGSRDIRGDVRIRNRQPGRFRGREEHCCKTSGRV